jgi:hypothetical protein
VEEALLGLEELGVVIGDVRMVIFVVRLLLL